MSPNYDGPETVNALEFDFAVKLFRSFFSEKLEFIEVPVQCRRSVIAACEDPKTISVFNHANCKWPLPQTGQMQLELEMMHRPNVPGYFCISTSYRNEPGAETEPVDKNGWKRHDLIFYMGEAEFPGNFDRLKQILRDFLEHCGFDMSLYREGDWQTTANDLGVTGNDFSAKEEYRIRELSDIYFLQNFPMKTSPYWNMKLDDTDKNIAKKVDVILYGVETLGCAERSCNVSEMRQMFDTISDGEYKQRLYALFGQERVEKELEMFMNQKFIPRSGFGMGMTRFIRALKLAGCMPKF